MSKKFFKKPIFLDFKAKSLSDIKPTPTNCVGLTLKGKASSLTRGIVQWSQEGFGYMTRPGEEE